MGVNSLARDTINSTVKYTTAQAGNSIYDVSSMVPIATINPVGQTGIVNIPQGYQDLVIVMNLRDTFAGYTDFPVYFGFNNLAVSGTYSWTELSGNGSSASSSRSSSNQFSLNTTFGPNATAGFFSSSVIHILNYANTSTRKTILHRASADRNGAGNSVLSVGMWQNTAAINEINFRNNFIAGSTVTLYGIKAVGQ